MKTRIENPGVLPDSLLNKMLRNKDIYYNGGFRSDVSPTLMSLCVADTLNGAKELVLGAGKSINVRLNVGIGDVSNELHFFADGTTTSARRDLGVVVYAENGDALPYQPETAYESRVSPQPKKGDLIATITAHNFPVIVKSGKPFANLRVVKGKPTDSLLDPRTLHDFLFIDGVPVAEYELDGRRVRIRLNLSKPVEDGISVLVAKNGVDRPIIPRKRSNPLETYYDGIPVCRTYHGRAGTYNLFCTLEAINLNGIGKKGEDVAGFMRRYGGPGDSLIVNRATMLNPEPPLQILIEIPLKKDTKLDDLQYIALVEFNSLAGAIDNPKVFNSGNCRSLGGKLFRTNGY